MRSTLHHEFPLLLTVQELLLVERKSRWLEGTIRRIGVHNEGPPYPHQLLLQVLLDSSAANVAKLPDLLRKA